MNTKHHEYLKYLIFNDAVSMKKMGMNHNAMDRNCMFEIFLAHIQNSSFEEKYKERSELYEDNKANFISDYDNLETYASDYAKDYLSLQEYKDVILLEKKTI